MGNKTIVALSLWLFGFSAVYSQEIPIQLMLVDNAGFEKVNQSVKLRLTMSNDTSSTLGQYQEVHITQSNEYGIISENLGSGVATTNSQVLSLQQFTFLTIEPIIKVELDTSSASNQYYSVGYVPYNYPMVARRALSADSSNYSDQSMNSEYADTAEFARNFNESFDGDTSASNELQNLILGQNGYLKLTHSSDSIFLQSSGDDRRISSLKGTVSYDQNCYQGNPQVFRLDTLASYSYVVPVAIFDSVGMFLTREYVNSNYIYSLLSLNLNSENIISFKNWGTNYVLSTQNEQHAYYFDNGSIYKLNAHSSYVDTISISSSEPTTKEHFKAFDNGDLTWLVGSSVYYYNSVSDSISSYSFAISPVNVHRLNIVGNDSLLLDNALIKPSNGTTLRQYNFTNVSSTQFYYSKSNRRIIYRVLDANNRWYSCDLEGLDKQVIFWDNGGYVNMKNVNIEGTMLFRTEYTQGIHWYNNYLANIPPPSGSSGYTNTPEWLCVDMNGIVIPLIPARYPSGDFLSLGSYTVRWSSYNECVTGSDDFRPGKLIRWSRY